MLLLKLSQGCVVERKSCLLKPVKIQAVICLPPVRCPLMPWSYNGSLRAPHQHMSLTQASYLLQAKQPQGITFWINVAIIVVFSVGGLLAAVGSIRQIAMHAQTYDLFH